MTKYTPKQRVNVFWSRVKFPDMIGTDECWEWKGPCSKDGYGQINKETYGFKRAHRYVWFITNGPIPDGKVIMHRCDNPPCCNPAHLIMGTQLDNIADRQAKGRNVNYCGEQNGRAKITAEDVVEIRRQRSQGETIVSIGKRFGISHRMVSCICLRQNWKHIP